MAVMSKATKKSPAKQSSMLNFFSKKPEAAKVVAEPRPATPSTAGTRSSTPESQESSVTKKVARKITTKKVVDSSDDDDDADDDDADDDEVLVDSEPEIKPKRTATKKKAPVKHKTAVKCKAPVKAPVKKKPSARKTSSKKKARVDEEEDEEEDWDATSEEEDHGGDDDDDWDDAALQDSESSEDEAMLEDEEEDEDDEIDYSAKRKAASSSRSSSSKKKNPVESSDEDMIEDSDEDQVDVAKIKTSARTKKLSGAWGNLLSGQTNPQKSVAKKMKKPAPKKQNVASAAPTGKRTTVKKAYTAGDDLPVISDPQAMFDDMVCSQLQDEYKPMLEAMTKTFRNRPLKVATMCSGTESPLLALDMLSKAIEDQNGKEGLAVEHVFSCEIEPYKQAYIERNFAPPVLFRDIRELGNDQACTAYGSLADVPNKPGCVDMLVAGTSCVDYSNLNNEKKTIDEKGESGQTWRGLEEWIIKAQPPIVIVENVYSAPWDKKIERFNKLGYHAVFLRLDTKQYYIPHTRQRGYLFAIKKKPATNSTAVTEWKGVVQSLQRPASASLDDMMFANDDDRVLRGRVRVASGNKSGNGESTGRVDWTKCEAIHHACRDAEELGDKRPFTGWSESGLTTTIGISWSEWVDAQVHRIHDLMDINTLRFAQQFVDPTYKTMIWNLSQNAHRDTTGRVGLSQCITPSGVPYVTSRVGPLVGEELLMLQGIPADDLLFTKEADSDLKDLAGNAMSTTVVGACMFAALLVGHSVVASGPNIQQVNGKSKVAPSLVPRALCPAPEDIEITRKEGAYESVPLRLSSLLGGKIDLAGILAEASSSAKKCHSEGANNALAACDLMECVDCGLTSSRACALPPRKFEEHNFEALPDGYSRIPPASFRAKILKVLPMCLQLQGLGIAQLEQLMTEDPKDKDDKALWNDWKQVFVETALELGETRNTDTDLPAEFRFTILVRSHCWTAVYESSRHARLELRLGKNEAVWFLFAKSPPMRGALREALVRPLARMRVGSGSFTDGSWEVCLPFCERVNLTITGKGEQVPSWRSRIGLRGEFEEETTFEVFEVVVADQSDDSPAASINGDYKALQRCGGACGSMRKRINGNAGSRDMFFFLESGRRTSPDADAYIFSEANHRTVYDEYRDVAVTIDPEIVYRPDCSCDENHQGSIPKTVRAMLPGKWIATTDVYLRIPNLSSNPRVEAPVKDANLEVSITKDGWKRCPEVVCCDLPLALSDPLIIECGKRGIESQPLSVNLKKSKRIFKRLLFVAARLDLPPVFSENWISIPSDGIERRNGEELVCHKSSPPKPDILWAAVRKNNRQMFIPMVDGKQAAIYEQLLKDRPASWNVQLKMLSKGRLQMHIACNAASLAHRALGLFPMGSFPRHLAIETLDCSHSVFVWRIVHHVDKSSEAILTGFPKMSLTSNKKDLPAKQPPGFEARYPLRIEQLRSLAWMLSQEATVTPFMEEEIVEAVLPNLKWRAEARVQRPVLVRGGIVADEVGYGKTAITLGLIAAAKEVNGPPPKPPKELAEKLISTDATLVIIPGHLMSQWPREIKKFMGNKVKILEIKTMVQFNSCTIKDLLDADIVLVNFTVLSGDKYFSRLARFTGAGGNGLPSGKTTNRHFNAVYEECLKGIEKRVQTIKNDGSATIYQDIEHDAAKYMESSTDLRLDGKKSVYKTVSEESTKGTKTQAKNKKAAVAKAAASEMDPWGLKEKKVKNDYKNLRCPPLELMYWNRVVVDEFHYLTEKADRGKVHTLVLGLHSNFRWCLSGTPPHEHFNDASGLAGLMGVHLGIADGLPGTAVTNGSLAKDKEKTDLEKLSALLDVRSIQWHENRHRTGQRFLDRFVRQNVAEIDEIPYEEHSVVVELPPAEKAIYLELEAHLKSLEMNSKKALKSRKTSSGDREARMQAVLEDSESAEEALLKRCAHFDMSSSSDSTALDVCDLIIRFRDEQLKSCEDDLLNLLVDALQQRERVLVSHPEWLGMSVKTKGEVEDRLEVFIVDIKKKNSVTGGADDEVQLRIQSILEDAMKEATRKGNESPAKGKKRKKHAEDDEDGGDQTCDPLYNMKYKLREHMHKVRTATKELCGRIRSLRYFQWVRNFQLEETTVSCSGYKSQLLSPHCACSSATEKLSRDKVGVLSCCGHIGCLKCLEYCADREVCIETHCQAPVKPGHVVSASLLGADRDHANAGNYGEKLTKIVKHTHQLVQQGDRVIVFVQFKDLKMKVMQAMDDLGVKALEVKGSVAQKTKALDVFQKDVPGKDDPRCLLLTMNDESAAGVNLTNCNHAIFVHPLLTDTQKQYEMYMTQAIGRIRRYGQTKKVHVWRFLARGTIDMDIFEQRTGEKANATLSQALNGPMPAMPSKRKIVAATPTKTKRIAAAPSRRTPPASPAVVQKRKAATAEITSARKSPRKKAKQGAKFYLNKRVAKFFDGNLFFGTVTHHVSGAGLWSIAYDDGDGEDLDAKEVKQYLKLYEEHEDLDGR